MANFVQGLPNGLYISTVQTEVSIEIEQIWFLTTSSQHLLVELLCTNSITTVGVPTLEHEPESTLGEYEPASLGEPPVLRGFPHFACDIIVMPLFWV